jgi:protein gp37
VEDKKYGLPRIEDLREAQAKVRFLSVEPLLEDLGQVRLEGVDWVIVGGESGARARPMQKEWVLSLRDQCRRRSVPFFFKQWGGVRKAAAGRQLDGRTYDEFPTRVSHPVMLAGDCALAAREAAGFSLSTNIFPVTLLAHQSEEKRC